jgi:hypothetical protein
MINEFSSYCLRTKLAAHIVSNGHMSGEVIRLDGTLRMAPRQITESKK